MDHQQQPIIQIELPQAVQDQIANLEQQVLLLQQHVGQPQPPPVHGPQLAPAPRFRLNFATYNAEGPNAEIDYDSFEQNIRVVSNAQGYPFPGVCDAVIAQLRGRAALMARDLVGRYDEFDDFDDFLQRLRSIFVSPAYMEKARAAFMRRIQQDGETIIAYHGTMRALWEKSFDADERQEALLIRQFIAGLGNPKIMEHLSLDPAHRTYRELLAEAMRLEGNFEVLKLNQSRRLHGGQSSAQQHMMMIPSTKSAPSARRDDVVPMEIGNLSINGRGTQRGRTRGRGFFRGRGSDRGRGGNRGTYRGFGRGYRGRGAFRPNTGQQDRMDINTLGQNQCAACLGEGHWAYECPTKKKDDERTTRGNQRGGYQQRGNRGRGRGFNNLRTVHYIEDGAASDSKN